MTYTESFYPNSHKPEVVSMESYADLLKQTIHQLHESSRASLAEVTQLDTDYMQLAEENARLRKLLEAQEMASQGWSSQESAKHSGSEDKRVSVRLGPSSATRTETAVCGGELQ